VLHAATVASGEWCETTTPRFVVVSDLDRAAVGELTESLGRLEVIAAPFLPGAAVPRPSAVRLVVFADREEFQRTFDTHRFAGFMQPSLKTNRLLIGPGSNAISDTALHEYAHYLLRNRLDVSLPPWFDEGLASVLGAAEFNGDYAMLGALPERRVRGLLSPDVRAHVRELSLRQVLAVEDIWSVPPVRMPSFYDWAWLLTHYFYFGPADDAPARREALTDYLTNRERGLVDYLGTTVPRLERALVGHVRRYSRVAVPLPAVQASETPTIRCLSATERDYEIAQSILAFNPAGALELIARLRSTDPANADLLVVESRARAALGEYARALEIAIEAERAGPSNANALVNLADFWMNECLFRQADDCARRWREVSTLYRAALRLDSERYDAVFGLGVAYLHTGRAGDGVNYLRVAYQHAPWAYSVNFFLGEGYRIIGDTRATTHLLNARNWSPEEAWRVAAEEALLRAGYTDEDRRGTAELERDQPSANPS
jgi:tetratricopeptide (TPR) repeat protein